MDLYADTPNYTTRQLFPLLDRILGFEAEQFLWGHDPQPMHRPEMEQFARKMRLIGEWVTAELSDTTILHKIETAGLEIEDDDQELIDTFRAGLPKQPKNP